MRSEQRAGGAAVDLRRETRGCEDGAKSSLRPFPTAGVSTSISRSRRQDSAACPHSAFSGITRSTISRIARRASPLTLILNESSGRSLWKWKQLPLPKVLHSGGLLDLPKGAC
jgi:hypothetical protein